MKLSDVLTRSILGHEFPSGVYVSLPVSCIVDRVENPLVPCRGEHKESPLVHMFTCEVPKMAVAANSSDVMAFVIETPELQHECTFKKIKD